MSEHIAAFCMDLEANCCVLHRFGSQLLRSAWIWKLIAASCTKLEAHCCAPQRFCKHLAAFRIDSEANLLPLPPPDAGRQRALGGWVYGDYTLQGLCCKGYAAGPMVQGLCCRGYAAGAMS